MYTHTIYSQTKTTQVPNPEAFVLLGEIGYVFRFDKKNFLKSERECVSFFTTGRRRLRLRPPSLFRKRDQNQMLRTQQPHGKEQEQQRETTRNNNTP